MRASRTDQNQAIIVAALRGAGASVFLTHAVGQGYPDLNVGIDGHTYLLEIKVEGAILTPDEVDFMRKWRGDYHVVRTPEEALKVIGRG